MLRCVATLNGKLIWKKDFAQDLGTRIPTWGIASAPLVDSDRLIAIVGAEPDGKVMAFDKRTGKELWRALAADSEVGYGQPVIIRSGGARQLIAWHPTALSALDPETGQLYWEERWEAGMGMTVATPVMAAPYLFVSQFYGGSLMMQLAADRPSAARLWQVGGKSELPDDTRALHALISTPVISGDYVFGVDSYGELRCLSALDGERIWHSSELTPPGRWGTAFIVRRGNRYFINNDQGDLIIARLTPKGYEEIDRTHLITPTSNSAWGRQRGRRRPSDRIVNWSHPAYANQHIFARNDEQILSASLKREQGTP
jgi:outer membrane protein assembly factor BamB